MLKIRPDPDLLRPAELIGGNQGSEFL